MSKIQEIRQTKGQQQRMEETLYYIAELLENLQSTKTMQVGNVSKTESPKQTNTKKVKKK